MLTYIQKIDVVYNFCNSIEVMNESKRVRKWAKEFIELVDELQVMKDTLDFNNPRKNKLQKRGQELVRYIYKYSSLSK